MKPFQLILTGVFVIFAIIGLLVFAGANPGGGQNKVGNVVIWGTLPNEQVREVLDQVRKVRTDFDGVTYIEVDFDEFHRLYTEALAVDRGPDMILVPHTLLLAELGTLAPISFDAFSVRDFEDSFVDGADIVVSTGYLGIPAGIDPMVMYYNKTMLNTARVSEAPKFWEQFTGLAPKFVQKTGGFSIEKSFVALGAYNNIRHAEKVLASFFFQVGSPIKDGAGRVVLSDTKDTESALRFYAEFANPNTSAYSWNKSLKEDRQAFLANDLAIYFAPASEGKSLQAANPNISIGSAAFPQLEGGIPVVYGDVYVFAVPRDARSVVGAQTAALAFVNTNVAEIFTYFTNIAPVRRNLLSKPQNDPLLDLAYEEAFIAKGWLSPQPIKVDSVFSAMVDDVVSGRSDAVEAITKAGRSLK